MLRSMSFPPQPPYDAPPPGAGGGFGPPQGFGPPPADGGAAGPSAAGGPLPPALPPGRPVPSYDSGAGDPAAPGGPGGYGPGGHGPEGYGPGDHGPEGYGPGDHGPEGYGPGDHGPEGHGPYGPPPPPPPGGPGGGAKIVGFIAGSVVLVALVIGAVVTLAGGFGDERTGGAASPSRPPGAPEGSASPSARPSGAGPAASGATDGARPGQSAGDLMPYVKLAPGTCFDPPALDSRVTEVTTRPCERPHDAEVIANERLTGTFATDKELRARVLALCEPDVRRRLRSIPRDNGVYYYSYVIYPALSTYRTQDEDTVSCALTLSDRTDGRQLTRPLP